MMLSYLKRLFSKDKCGDMPAEIKKALDENRAVIVSKYMGRFNMVVGKPLYQKQIEEILDANNF